MPTLTLNEDAVLSGSNSGDQTDIPGNAATATKLQTARKINGVDFDGTGNITINIAEVPAPDPNEDRRNAVAVTLLRPSKIKWKVGNFGTFTPTERIYIRTNNLCRFGPDVSNYTASVYSRLDPKRFRPFPAGQPIVAHGAFSSVSYVTQSDVDAVVNPTRTLNRMLAYLDMDNDPVPYQVRASGPSSGGSNRVGASAPITPGTSGSIVMDVCGQGYEVDLVGSTGGTDYVYASLASKSAQHSDNQWGYSWFGLVDLVLPIAQTMDGNGFSWSLKAYTADTTYDALANASVVNLPTDWDTDVT